MDLSFVTATNLGELTNARSKRQIRQHASKEMWKVRKRDHIDPDKGLALRITRKPARRPHEHSSQQIIVYPQSTRRLISDSRQHTGLMTPVSCASDDNDTFPDGKTESSDAVQHVSLSPTVSRLGAGRLDPFAHYPVEIGLTEQRILYHGQSACFPLSSYCLSLLQSKSVCGQTSRAWLIFSVLLPSSTLVPE